ncbi:hypothetical protein N431DRAFT_460183 [Stipitochalara longipes BDJ]|nr:hypothetical protein N431DRAFT_460183 [Stipitochalara longipes BDJ]
MPPAGRNSQPNSQDIIANLLSEARHLVSRERTTEDDNLLQIQQVIEAAQWELRRLRLHTELERFRAREEVEMDVRDISMNNVRRGHDIMNDGEGSGHSSPDYESGGIISTMARMGQIIITLPRDSAESEGEATDETVQTNRSTTELDSNLGDATDWTLAGLHEVLQQLPEHGDTWRLAETMAGLPPIQTERSGTDEEALPSDDAVDSGPDLIGRLVRYRNDHNDMVHLTRREVGNTTVESSTTGETPTVPSGRSLVYTDFSRLRREQPYVNFTDSRVGQAASTNTPNPGHNLDQTTRNRDSWVIRLSLDTHGENLLSETDGESSESSEEDFDALTPLPSPPPSPPALSRETTPLSSTGATVGSEIVLEETKNGSAEEEQLSFSKERRAQLMAAMNADIAKHSQEREWAFYREQGYSLLPRIHCPELV